jgi:hypothetical protein
MLQRKFSVQPECRSRAGPTNARTLACTAVIIAAGLGLTACVGTYDDGYTHTRLQYQPSPNYNYDNGYEQRRRSAYRQYPYASPDQRRWDDAWWRGAIYSPNSYSYER